MIIEVRGTGTHNKGAELMLCAIRQRLLQTAPDARLAVNASFGPYAERARYGLWTKVPQRGRGRSFFISQLMTASYRRNLGLVAEGEIEAVLDASGLAFSDQWGPGPVENLADAARKWKRRGIPSVLLPQAFGPFENPRVRDAMKRALDYLSLVYARDATSLNYLTELCSGAAHIRRAPDFTNLVAPADTTDVKLPERCAAVVPNIRMLDRATASEQSGYIPFLALCIRAARGLGLNPVMIFHDFEADGKLANLVDRELGFNVPRNPESCPVRLKGLLSRSEVVIGSRFHALVGALSSGVPSLATTWSHKYEALFEDYKCPEFVVTSSATASDIAERLSAATTEPSRSRLRTLLQERSREFRQQTIGMFEEVESRIGLRAGSKRSLASSPDGSNGHMVKTLSALKP